MQTANEPHPHKPGGRAIPWLSLLVVVILLGYVKPDTNGWVADPNWNIHVKRLSFGAPFTWISLTSLQSSGTPPPLKILPEGAEYQPGLDLDLIHLGFDLVFAIPVALLVVVLLRFVMRALARRGQLPSGRGTIAVLIGGILAGGTVPTRPSWIGLVLFAVAVPGIVTALSWRRHSVVLSALYVGLGVVSMCLVQQITCALSVRFTPFSIAVSNSPSFSIENHVIAPISACVVALLAVLAVIGTRKLAAHRGG